MNTFTITDEQEAKIAKWREDKNLFQRECRRGSTYSYIFTPNGIGVSVRVKHIPSGEELDVSDGENW